MPFNSVKFNLGNDEWDTIRVGYDYLDSRVLDIRRLGDVVGCGFQINLEDERIIEFWGMPFVITWRPDPAPKSEREAV